MSAPRPFISLIEASFRLGEQVIFEDTTWAMGRDEQWAVLGPNGSGKALFAEGLCGRLPLVKGELRYHFRPPRGLIAEESIALVSFATRRQSQAGLTMQSRWNSLEMDVGSTVSELLSYECVMEVNPFEVRDDNLADRAAFEKRRRTAVQKLDLHSLLERHASLLSTGEAQRVQLARALCRPLRLLILDDPFIGLDTNNRRHFRDFLEKLMRSGLRVIVITPRTDDLPAGVTHLLCLNCCRVASMGPRWELPTQAFAAKESPANTNSAQPLSPNTRLRWARNALRAPRNSLGSATELVRLRNVHVRYGELDVLRGVNWTICEGESWALLGPNGSGKTTLLSLIMGDNPQAYTNEVVVFGKRRGSGESIWELKTHIGWVSPELQLHFAGSTRCLAVVLSGFDDTVGLFRRPKGQQQREAQRWLARFGLKDFESMPLAALSAGQQRMVLLARALVKKPRLLILDEPCQGLDAAHRDAFLQMVEHLMRQDSATVIYVTHREEEIPPSIHRVLRLRYGEGRVSSLLPGRSKKVRRKSRR